MPSRRSAVSLAVGITSLVVVFAIASLVLTRDETPAARGDVIAYSCKEPGNPWYAICVIRATAPRSGA